MKLLIIAVFFTINSVYAKCSKMNFCGVSYEKDLNIAKSQLVNSISSKVSYEYTKRNLKDLIRNRMVTNQVSSLPVPEVEVYENDKFIKVSISKEKFFKFLKYNIELLESDLSSLNYSIYKKYIVIYNYYNPNNKLDYNNVSSRKLKFSIENYDEKNIVHRLVKNNMENRGYFFSKHSERSYLKLEILNKTTYEIFHYNVLSYNLNYIIRINKDKKKDIKINKTLLARSKNEYLSKRDKYLKYVLKNDI